MNNCCIFNTIIDERHSSYEKYTSHFIWKGCVWEGVGDRTEMQHIDPHSCCHQRSFPVLQGCSTGGRGTQLSAGCCFLYSIISPTLWSPKLINRRELRAPYVGCWLSLPHLVSNRSGLQILRQGPEGSPPLLGTGFLYRILSPTDWISCALSYIIVHAHSISPHNWPSQYELPPSLEWHVWSGWRSIYDTVVPLLATGPHARYDHLFLFSG